MPRAVGPNIDPRRLRKSGNTGRLAEILRKRPPIPSRGRPTSRVSPFGYVACPTMSDRRHSRIILFSLWLGCLSAFSRDRRRRGRVRCSRRQGGWAARGQSSADLGAAQFATNPVAETQLDPEAGPKSAHDRQTQREKRTLDPPVLKSVGRPTLVWSWRSGSPPWRRSRSRRPASCLGRKATDGLQT